MSNPYRRDAFKVIKVITGMGELLPYDGTVCGQFQMKNLRKFVLDGVLF